MYIRRTLTRSLPTGEQYYSHRLVRSERIGGRVRQVTLLNLGQNFLVAPNQWEALCARIEEVLGGHMAAGALMGDPAVEREAQRLAALLLTRQARVLPLGFAQTSEPLDLASLELARARSVGVELVALWAVRELRLSELFEGVGMSRRQVSATVGMIVGQMAASDPEHAVLHWWCERSAIGELLGVDFTAFGPSLLTRAGDGLLKYRKTLEEEVAARVQALFSLSSSESTYDLSQVRVDGATGSQVMGSGPFSAVAGCDASCAAPGVILGLALDGNAIIRRSASCASRALAESALKRVLDDLGAPPGASVTVDRDLADEVNLAWLRAAGFSVLIASTEQTRAFRPAISLPAPGAAGPDGEAFAAAHLLISVLAYQCAQVVRRRLALRGIDAGWSALRQILGGQCRVTTSFRLGDGRTLHVRQATRAEPEQLAIYQALGIDPAAGAVQKTVI